MCQAELTVLIVGELRSLKKKNEMVEVLFKTNLWTKSVTLFYSKGLAAGQPRSYI